MNSVKIETKAILVLRNVIWFHSLMHDFIKDNDKEPSWDGYIYLYKDKNLKADEIRRVPVQVKGYNNQDLLNRRWIQYPIEYKHLRNYKHDGGVFYIVVVISDDGNTSAIYYNHLTPIKLSEILKDSESKLPDQRKNITLQKLTGNESDNLYRLLYQFHIDCEKQGRGNNEIIKKAININNISQVDSLQAVSFTAKTEADLFKELIKGDISLYGHRADFDMWLPFEYSFQRKMIIKKINKKEQFIGIDGINYYNSYVIEQQAKESNNVIIRVSDNLVIDIKNGKFHFEAKGTLESLLNDIEFIKALQKGKSLYIDNIKLELGNVKIQRNLRNILNNILDLSNAFTEIGFVCTKKFADFTDENWKSINQLLNIYHRYLRPKKGSKEAWHIWYWDDKIVPVYFFILEDGSIEVVNWLTTTKHYLFINKNGNEYKIPNFYLFKRDILEKLYDIEKNFWFKHIDSIEITENIIEEMFLAFIELVAAYDITKKDVYFEVAENIIDKVLKIFPENEIGIINKMQLSKRKRDLTEDEMLKLEAIEDKSNITMIKCAANILLENRRKAQKLLAELSEEEQSLFKNFPIYNLL